MSNVRCGCSRCEFNKNTECQAEDVEFKSEKEEKGEVTCNTFKKRRPI